MFISRFNNFTRHLADEVLGFMTKVALLDNMGNLY